VTFTAVHLDEGHSHGGNDAGQVHDLVILRHDSDGSLETVGRSGGIPMGGTSALTVQLEAGQYELICDVVEEVDGKVVSHFNEGMHASFTVT
jgi:hypothetical protein